MKKLTLSSWFQMSYQIQTQLSGTSPGKFNKAWKSVQMYNSNSNPNSSDGVQNSNGWV